MRIRVRLSNYPTKYLTLSVLQFAAGAMENWGLVTYREVELLCDPQKASNQQKQRVCTVVTHELAHQWFGNLVTMAWWDDLWLNEGFASWAENWCANEIHPNYKMWDQFTTGHLSAAMRLDAMKSSHPIQVPIGHAEEVRFPMTATCLFLELVHLGIMVCTFPSVSLFAMAFIHVL